MDLLFDRRGGLPMEMQLEIFGRLEGAWFVRLMRLAQAHHNVLVRRRTVRLTADTKRSILTLKGILNVLSQKTGLRELDTYMLVLAQLPKGQLNTSMRTVLTHHIQALDWFAANPNAEAVITADASMISRHRPPPLRPFSVDLTLGQMLTMYRALTLIAGTDVIPWYTGKRRLEDALAYLDIHRIADMSDAFLDTFVWLSVAGLVRELSVTERPLLTDNKRTEQWRELLYEAFEIAIKFALPRTFALCLEQAERLVAPPDNKGAASLLREKMALYLRENALITNLVRGTSTLLRPEDLKAWDRRMAEIIRTWASASAIEFAMDPNDFFVAASRRFPSPEARESLSLIPRYTDLYLIDPVMDGFFIDNVMYHLARANALHSLDALVEWFASSLRYTIESNRNSFDHRAVSVYSISTSTSGVLHHAIANASTDVFQWFMDFRFPSIEPILERLRVADGVHRNDGMGVLAVARFIVERHSLRLNQEPVDMLPRNLRHVGFAHEMEKKYERLTDEKEIARIVRLVDANSDTFTYQDLERVRFFNDDVAVMAVFRSFWLNCTPDTYANMRTMLRSSLDSFKYAVVRYDDRVTTQWQIYRRTFNAITEHISDNRNAISEWIGLHIMENAMHNERKKALEMMLREFVTYDREDAPSGFANRIAIFKGFLKSISVSIDDDDDDDDDDDRWAIENLEKCADAIRLLFVYIPTRPDAESRQINLRSRKGEKLLEHILDYALPDAFLDMILNWQDMSTEGVYRGEEDSANDSDSDQLEATLPRIDMSRGMGLRMILYAIRNRSPHILRRLREWTYDEPISLTDADQQEIMRVALLQTVSRDAIIPPSTGILNELRQWRNATATPSNRDGRYQWDANLPNNIGFSPYHYIGGAISLPPRNSEALQMLEKWESEYQARLAEWQGSASDDDADDDDENSTQF